MRKLSFDAWVERLAGGDLAIAPVVAGFGSFGGAGDAWGWTGRRVGYHVVYMLVQGGVRVRLCDARGSEAAWRRATAGQVIWLAPGVRHDLAPIRPGERFTLYYARLDARLAGRSCKLATDLLITTTTRDARRWFRDLVDTGSTTLGDDAPDARYRAARVRGLLILLSAAILSAARWEQTAGRAPRQGLTASQRQVVERTAAAALRRRVRVTPRELAAAAALAPGYFAKRFKGSYGIPPRAWLLRERFRSAAAELIETSSSITQVAASFGYDDLYLFSRQFTTVHGCSPREFRRRHQALRQGNRM